MKRRTLVWIVGLVAAGGALAFAGISTASSITATGTPLPTALAITGELSLDVNAIGELRAMRVIPISTPPVGGMLRILNIAATGTRVEEGDVIVEFDPADQLFQMEQAESNLAEAEQEIVRRKAQLAVSASQGQVELLTARFNVRRAELDIRGDADLVAANERKKRELNLEEAKRRLAQLEQDLKSRAATEQADLQVVIERANRSRMEHARAKRNIESMVITATQPGLVVVRDNRDSMMSGGFFYPGMAMPEYKVGDQTGAGRPIVDLYDITGMEVRTRIDEHQRANVNQGQNAIVHFDSLPGVNTTAKVMSVANLATRSMEGPSPIRQFDATVRLDKIDERLRPGTTTRIQLKGATVTATHVPRTAVFEKDGKPVVYVRRPDADRFEAVAVKVTHRTEARTAVEGISAGTEVSLVNPEKNAKKTNGNGAAAPAGPAPGGPR